jgi:outer membrane cobalamin receptor
VDLYYPGFSNASLQPERTQSFDATLSDAHLLGGTSLTWFTLAGNNLIVVNPAYNYSAAPGPANEPLVNAEHASIAGLTLDAHTQPFHGWTTTLGLTNLYRALNLTTTAIRLAGRPVLSTSLAVEYESQRPGRQIVALGFIARSMSARSFVPPLGTPDPTQYAAAYTGLQAYVRYRIAPRALVTLRALNLFDERYAAIASPPFGGYPAPGRSYAVELSTR